jgi:hypothetical protein
MAFASALLPHRVAQVFLGLALAILVPAAPRCYAGSSVDRAPQIEYISPDGKFSSLSVADVSVRKSTATFVDVNTVSCALKEGETTFIIELPAAATSDRLTFLNENAAACGELRIAVSNSALPADSPKWTQVDGIVPFAHKRLFKLSMLGVETKFVRLSFKVDSQENNSAGISHPFRGSILAESIESNFAKLGTYRRELNLATLSVGPLSAPNAK